MNQMPPNRPSLPSYPWLSPPMATLLFELNGNSMQRTQRYIHERTARQVGLQRFAAQLQGDIQTLLARGDQENAQKLMMIGRSIAGLADPTSLIDPLVEQETQLQINVQRILGGLPPVLTVAAQPQQPPQQAAWGQQQQQQAPQPPPMTPEQYAQGQELLARVAQAQPMPLVGAPGPSLAPQTVTQAPTAPQPVASTPGAPTVITVSQQPTPPAIAAANAAVNGSTTPQS